MTPTPFVELLELLAAAEHALPAHLLGELLGDRDAVERAEEACLVQIGADGLVAPTSAAPPVSLGRLRRARRRRRLGHALVGSTVEPKVVARHLLDGAIAVPDPDGVRIALDVLDDLVDRGDLDDAVALAGEALLVVGADGSDPVPRVRVLAALASALAWAGRADEAEVRRLEAIRVARASGDSVLIAMALLTWTGSAIPVGDDPANTVAVDHALGELHGNPDPRAELLRVRLLGLRAERSVFIDLPAARTTADVAVAEARRLGDPETLLRNLSAQRLASWHAGHQDLALALAEEMIAVAPGSRRHAEVGTITRLQVLSEIGDFVRFDAELARLRQRVDHTGTRVDRVWTHVLAGARALVRGDWDGVDAQATAARDLSRGAGYEILDQLLLAQDVLVAWQRGADLAPLVGPRAGGPDPLPAGPLRDSWRACLLGLAAPTLDRDAVEAGLLASLANGTAGLREDLTWGPVVACLSMAAAVARSTHHARALADAISPVADQWAGTGGAVSFGPFRWHLGRLLGVLGEHSSAEAHLRVALEMCLRADAGPWAARVHLSLATLDPIRHRDHADRALVIATDLGLERVARSARRTLGSTDGGIGSGARTPATPAPAGLTIREVEVLVLVAGGCTNRDIAGRLFLSVKTVERHLLNAYTKLGVRNRSEATAFMLRHGLAE